MNASKFHYIWNSKDKFEKNICYTCGKEPAVHLDADCHGDAVGPFCIEHWEEWFKREIIDCFDKKENFVQKEDKWIYVY
jgi:hypothetical protein